jgi:hypothetical protein
MTDKFLESIGVPPVPRTIDLTPTTAHSHDINHDFERIAVPNLLAVMQITKNAIDNLNVIATQSQDPESYTALGGLIRAFGQQQSQLLQMHKMITPDKKPDTPPSVNMQAGSQAVVFQGSTDDLMRALRPNKND